MGETTKIAWTDHTFNPWRGCTRVSPGCQHCYAATWARRFGMKWGEDYRFFRPEHWQEPERWNTKARRDGVRRRVFCGSMCDVFEAAPELDEHRARLWRLIGDTPDLDWLLLTKRPENIPGMVPATWRDGLPGNVWPGATAEDQQRAFERARHILKVRATARFLSLEPLLEDIELEPTGALGCDCGTDIENLGEERCTGHCQFYRHAIDKSRAIDWVIVGGESGAKARTCNLSHIRNVIHDCEATGVACFVKQMGAHPVDSLGVDDDEDPLPVTFGTRNGDDPAEWDPYLQVREFPEAVKAATIKAGGTPCE